MLPATLQHHTCSTCEVVRAVHLNGNALPRQSKVNGMVPTLQRGVAEAEALGGAKNQAPYFTVDKGMPQQSGQQGSRTCTPNKLQTKALRLKSH